MTHKALYALLFAFATPALAHHDPLCVGGCRFLHCDDICISTTGMIEVGPDGEENPQVDLDFGPGFGLPAQLTTAVAAFAVCYTPQLGIPLPGLPGSENCCDWLSTCSSCDDCCAGHFENCAAGCQFIFDDVLRGACLFGCSENETRCFWACGDCETCQ